MQKPSFTFHADMDPADLPAMQEACRGIDLFLFQPSPAAFEPWIDHVAATWPLRDQNEIFATALLGLKEAIRDVQITVTPQNKRRG